MLKKFISWNVNGIRAASRGGALKMLSDKSYFGIAIQEIKADEKSMPEEISRMGYYTYINSAKKRGYSGTMSLAQSKPIGVSYGFEHEEGRIIDLEFDRFHFINVYFPNAQPDLARLNMKIDFDNKFMEYADSLRKSKPLIICGDFNVAHEDIDIARPEDNKNHAGFTDLEREWVTKFLSKNYIDTFRMFTKEGGHYSWWSYQFNARSRNIGWRIDYFVVSSDIKNKVKSSYILKDIKGSDHAPIVLEIDI
ncbi:MAG: exodeoxyribonuclease III [Candidatus Micrarchaeia archaeon]